MTKGGKGINYRPCAGVCLFDAQGRVWLGRRYGAPDPWSWQFPQGGLDRDEKPLHGAIRELCEETGLHVNHLSPLGKIEDWLHYDIPKAHRRRGRKWQGQRQKWFAFRFHGTDDDFDLNAHQPAEFSEFKWTTLSEALELIIPFKRPIYERLAVEFAHLERPQ